MSVKKENLEKLNTEVTEAYRAKLHEQKVQKEKDDEDKIKKNISDKKERLKEQRSLRELAFAEAYDEFKQTRFRIDERGQKISDWDDLDNKIKKALSSESTTYNREFTVANLGLIALYVDVGEVLFNTRRDLFMRYGHAAKEDIRRKAEDCIHAQDEMRAANVLPMFKKLKGLFLTPEGTISIPALMQEVSINDKNELDASLTEKNNDIALKFDESFENVVADWLETQGYTRGTTPETKKIFFDDCGTPLDNTKLTGLKNDSVNGLRQYLSTQLVFDIEESPSKGPSKGP